MTRKPAKVPKPQKKAKPAKKPAKPKAKKPAKLPQKKMQEAPPEPEVEKVNREADQLPDPPKDKPKEPKIDPNDPLKNVKRRDVPDDSSPVGKQTEEVGAFNENERGFADVDAAREAQLGPAGDAREVGEEGTAEGVVVLDEQQRAMLTFLDDPDPRPHRAAFPRRTHQLWLVG